MSQTTFDQALRHHRAGELEQAGRLYRQILSRDPSDAPALHHLALVAQATGGLQDACELLQRAVDCHPCDAVAHNNLANVLRQLQRLPEAVESYRTAVRCDSGYINAHFNLASLLMELEDPQSAAECYRKVLHLAPDDADATGALGVALMELGNEPAAIDCFRRVTRLRPDDASASYNLGTSLKDTGDTDAALDFYRRAVRLNPDYAEAHNNIGLLLKARGELNHAIEAFEDALRSNPRHTKACLNLAAVLLAKGENARAERISREAVGTDPRNPAALQSLGAVLIANGDCAEAQRVLHAALDMDPDLSDVRLKLGLALQLVDRISEAIMEYRAVAAHTAAYRFAQNNLGLCLTNQGRTGPAVGAYSRALEVHPGYSECHSNLLFCLNYPADIAPSALYAKHREWARRHATSPSEAPPMNVPRSDRPLRIGYVSGDFCYHSVANFLGPLIAGHDRREFQVICYSDVREEDETTQRFRNLASQWRDLRGLDDDKVSELIRADGIHILVDLAGHTRRNRMCVFARRVAPVQVTYLGYPNTTGLEEMDYRLTDAIADPPGDADALHSEELVQLPGGFLCFATPSDAPEVNEVPALGDGRVTFGSFNNISKVNELVVAVWARILKSLPQSRLLLKSQTLADEGAQRRLRRLFGEQGIDEARIELMGKLPNRREHLRTYNQVDVGLDPFPYNGTTTTCEAMWMGVPVVTLAGHVHRGRVGASLLHGVGLDELVAPSIDSYVEKALELARDPGALTELRHTLRQRMADSPLTDARRAVTALESAYRDMWRRYRESAME